MDGRPPGNTRCCKLFFSSSLWTPGGVAGALILTHAHAPAHAHAHTHTLTRARARSHTHTHSRTRTLTHTHTHTNGTLRFLHEKKDFKCVLKRLSIYTTCQIHGIKMKKKTVWCRCSQRKRQARGCFCERARWPTDDGRRPWQRTQTERRGRFAD